MMGAIFALLWIVGAASASAPRDFDDIATRVQRKDVDGPLVERVLAETSQALGHSFVYEERKGNFVDAMKWAELAVEAANMLRDVKLQCRTRQVRGKILDLGGRHREADEALKDLAKACRDEPEAQALVKGSAYLSLVRRFISVVAQRTAWNVARELEPGMAQLMNEHDAELEKLSASVAEPSVGVRVKIDQMLVFWLSARGMLANFREFAPEETKKGILENVVTGNFTRKYLRFFEQTNAPGTQAFASLVVADLAFVFGFGEVGLQYAEEAARIYKTIGDLVGEANVDLLLGDVLAAPHHGIYGFNFPVSQMLEASNLKTLGYGVSLLPDERSMSRDFPKARDYYQKALGLFQEAGAVRGVAEVELRNGYLSYKEGNAPAAIRFYEHAIELYESTGDQHGAAVARLHAAIVATLSKRFGLGEELAEKIVEWGKRQAAYGFLEAAAALFSNIGQEFFHSRADYNSAFYCFSLTRLFLEAIDAPLAQALWLLTEAPLYEEIGQTEETLGLYQTILSRYERVEGRLGAYREKVQEGGIYVGPTLQEIRRNQARVYQAVGGLYLSLGKYQEAESAFRMMSEKARELAPEEVGSYEGFFSHHMVFVHLARKEFERAMEIAQGANDPTLIGHVYLHWGRHEEAVSNLLLGLKGIEEEIEELRKGGEKASIVALYENSKGSILLALETAYRKMGNIENALRVQREWMELPSTWQDRIHEPWDVDFRFGLTYEQQGDLEKALDHYRRSVQVLEDHVATIAPAEFSVGLLEKQTHLYGRLIGLLLRMQKEGLTPKDASLGKAYQEVAFYYSEKSKAQVLLNMLGSGGVYGAGLLTEREREREQQLNSEIRRINMLLSGEASKGSLDPAQTAELEARLTSVREDYASFQKGLFVKHPDLSFARGKERLMSAADATVLARKSRVTFLEYFVGREKTFIFVISESGLRVYEADITGDGLRAKIETLLDYGRLFRPRRRALARELHDLLVKPAEKDLREGDLVCIVPDKFLFKLPFQELMDDAERYFWQKYALFYSPSVSVLAQLNRIQGKPVAGKDSLAVFALPLSEGPITWRGAEIGSLPETEAEAAGILSAYPKSQAYLGKMATEDRLKKEGDRYAILHFATHALLDEWSPMYSSLLLSQAGEKEDGFLEAREVAGMRLSARLAVLSACTTLGKPSRSEAVVGLTRAFFIAGVPAVVVSQWNVDDRSAALLMISFYKELKGGMAPAQALRHAALEMESRGEYSHPFDWAPFILVGRAW